MYGNNRKPGIYEGNKSRLNGSLWLGYPEATWFRTAKVKGDAPDEKPLPLGSIVKEEFADGTFVPAKESDIFLNFLRGMETGLQQEKHNGNCGADEACGRWIRYASAKG